MKSTWVAFFFLGIALAPSQLALAQTRWSGDECIHRQRVESELARLRPDSADLSVDVLIERTSTGVLARVSRGSLRRELEASNCDQLEASLLLVLSLFPAVEEASMEASRESAAAEGSAPLETPAESDDVLPRGAQDEHSATTSDELPALRESPPNPSESQGEVTPAPDPAAEAPSDAALAAWVGAGLDLDVGSLSRPSFAPSLTFSLERKRLWLALSGAYQHAQVHQLEVGEVSMSRAHIGLAVGGYVWKSARERSGLLLSGGGSTGLIRAESRNISQPREGRAVQLALQAHAHLHWRPLQWLRLRFEVGFGVPLIRAEYQIQGIGAFHTTPSLVVRAGVFLELRFWSRNSS